MFTPKNKKKYWNNFLLVQSMINYPVHYHPYKYSRDSNNINNNLLMKNLKKINSISEYSKKKYKNKISLLKKVQQDKIDIYINNIYDKMNNNIRDYNYKKSYQNKLKLKPLSISKVMKESIKDNLINKYNNILMNKNPFANSQQKLDEELIWSNKILEQKKLSNYRRTYSLKYIKINNKTKFIIKNMQNSFNLINNIFKNKNNKTFYKYNTKKIYSSEK